MATTTATATATATGTITTTGVGENVRESMDTHRLWCSVLGILRDQVPEPSFRTWLEGTQLHDLAGTPGEGQIASGSAIPRIPIANHVPMVSGVSGIAEATVSVPSNFAAEWLQRRYRTLITEALEKCLGRRVAIKFKVEAVRSGRTLRALDGVGTQHDERRRPIAVGQSAPLSLDPPSAPAPFRQSPSSGAAAVSDSGARAYTATIRPNGTSDAKDVHAARATSRLLPSASSKPGQDGQGSQNQRAGRTLPLLAPLQAAGLPPLDRAVLVPALNPRYTFDRFLVGRGNQLAASVARRVAEAPGTVYNPLFIYGLRGVGKTHLLEAIGHDAYKRTEARVLFASALQFREYGAGSHLASTISLTGSGASENCDLLLVDDLHYIAGRSGRNAQQALELLVEHMLAAGKGVVVTALHPPDAMLALEDTLRFRLRGGMVVAIGPPDSHLRTRMVQHLADEAGVRLAPGALQLLASAGQSMAEARAAWERAAAHHLQATAYALPRYGECQGQVDQRGYVEDHDEQRTGDRTTATPEIPATPTTPATPATPASPTTSSGSAASVTPTLPVLPARNTVPPTEVSTEDVRIALDSMPHIECHTCVRPETIIDQVSAYFDLELNELSSASRGRRVILPRHIAMYLMREETDATYEWIAHRFARQDHTTSMYACARIEELMETDPEVRQMVLELRQMVHGEQCRGSPDARVSEERGCPNDRRLRSRQQYIFSTRDLAPSTG